MKKVVSVITAVAMFACICISSHSIEGEQDNYDIISADSVNLTASEVEVEDGIYYYYKSGERAEVSAYFATKLIECCPENVIVINNGESGHICFYDEEQKFISGTLINQTWYGITYDNSFVIPENCAFFRMSSKITHKDSFSISIFDNSDNDPNDSENSENDSNNNNPDNNSDNSENSDNNSSTLEKTNNSLIFKYVVAADGSGDFTSVSEAVRNASSGDSIYIKSGEYDEIIDLPHDKSIHLVGENRCSTIIYNTNGDYFKAPILMGGGVLEELTVYSKKVEGSDQPNHTSYAVHIERDSLYNDSLLIKNCIIKSDWNSALGMGMRGGCDVILENCDFIHNGNGSALYFHDSDTNSRLGEQHITVRNCRLESKGSPLGILFLQSQNKSDVYVTFQNNFIRTKSGVNNIRTLNWYGGSSDDPDDFLHLYRWKLTNMSYGNNIPELNAE